MAAITDLTWAQLATALGGSNKIVVSSNKVMIDVSLVTGDNVATTDTAGVVEFLSKVLDAAATAQVTVNQSQAAGERLAAFPPATYGAVSNGYVSVTQTINGRVSVAPSTQSVIIGPVV